MSSLGQFRDHCAKMATAEHKPECVLPRPGYWEDIHPHPACRGCNSASDRALFALLAAEVDDYLPPQVDLLGEVTAEPIPSQGEEGQ